MAQVIVTFRDIRIDVAEAEVNAFYKGNEASQALIYKAVQEKLTEMMSPTFIGDGLIDDLEVEESEEEQ